MSDMMVDQSTSFPERSHLLLEANELVGALHKLGIFVISQGAYQDHSSFALAYVSRLYQALSLWPVEYTQLLVDQAKHLSPSDRVELGAKWVDLLQ